jgi:NH3-dependent NAD+ synthetase
MHTDAALRWQVCRPWDVSKVKEGTMKLANRKTRKAIRKSVRKVIKKHGPEAVAGLAGGLASALATLASTDAPGTKGKKSNLAKLSQQVSTALAGDDSKKSRKRTANKTRNQRAKGDEESLEADESE